jgi:hypothetical protein
MRKSLLLSTGLIIASCSAPKYTYHFDHYDYNAGRKNNAPVVHSTPDQRPLVLNEGDLMASASANGPAAAEAESLNAARSHVSTGYKKMTKAERKAFRKEIKTRIKEYAGEVKSGKAGANVAATKELDNELKLAIIFGAVGITLTVLGGINTIFWVLGIVGLVIGLVFFIRWIQTQ